MSVYHQQAPFGGQAAFPQPVTSLSFDPASDILWAGNTSGLINAWNGASRMRGVSYYVARGHPVQKISVSPEGVVHACAGIGVGSWGKSGVNKWYYETMPTKGATTFEHHPSKPHTLVIAQAAPEFLFLNSTTGSVMRTMSAPSVVTALKSSPNALLAGSADGVLRLYDFRTGNRSDSDASELSVLAHVGGVISVDASGTAALTIGWNLRQARPHPDPIVKLFDLRMLRPLPPIPFQDGPAFINVHPKNPSLLSITSSQGLVNIVDMTKTNDGGEFHQMDVSSYITAVAVSPTGAYMAFGDADGTLHTLTSTSEDDHVPFNGSHGRPVEWADAPEPLPEIAWDDKTPLNTIGMPFYDSELLSYYDYPLAPMSTAVPPPQKIPTQVLSSVRVQDHLQYAILPKELRGQRNVVKSTPRRVAEGRFRSELARRHDDTPQSPSAVDSAYPDVPSLYHRIAIKYSKFGVEDFDFSYYNRTKFSGLETDIPNSYANSLIQVLHACIPIRRLAKSHITTSCRTEHCLLCEFGFVVRMLEDARGINLQARNFCVTVGRKATAQSFGLIDRSVDGDNADYAGMIQQLNRFLLDEFAAEGNAFPKNPHLVPQPEDSSSTAFAAAPITQLLGFDAKTVTVCSSCAFQRDKDLMSHVVDLIYPRKNETPSGANMDFAAILRSSLERDIVYKSTCQVCKNLSNHRSRRALSSLHMPPLLAVNAAVNTEDQHKFWLNSGTSKFLKSEVTLPMRDADGVIDPNSAENVTYALRGYIAEIKMGTVRHLVAIVKAPPPEPLMMMMMDEDDEEEDGWYLFNDFAVRRISEDEALSFPGKWKVPCVLYLERVDTVASINYSGLPQQLDPAILGQKISMAAQVNWAATKHEVLSSDETPTVGTIISIDAEFVALQQEESEIRSDGTKKVLKPSQLTLARVSVIRGNPGPKFGVPFIDDYIHTSDTIVDYLTEFSGIQPGDLHPNYSTHVLLPLKVVYKKLRLLVDLGCIFVGHGLSKDFRIINIFVPPERVLDTVDIYFIQERQRRLSLRFLSYCVLKEEIQIDTHDSIEDARAALLLHQKWADRDDDYSFNELKQWVYAEGKKLNFKPPDKAKPPTPTLTPSASAVQAPLFPDAPRFQSPPMYQSPHSGQFHSHPGMMSFPGGPLLPPWGGPGR